MLEIKNLHFSYKKKSILQDINLKLDVEKIFFLLGANGSGKSTLIKCILSILDYKVGEIYFRTKPLNKMTYSQRSSVISYIPQEHKSFFNHSVLDIILMGKAGKLRFYESPSKEDIKEAKKILEKLGIERLVSSHYEEISGGERQLVLIGRALMQDTKLLVMDEPYSNLDFGNQIRFMNILRQLREQGYTILLSSHNPQDAFLYADEVIVLHEGRILSMGDPNDVLKENTLSTMYNQKIEIFELPEKNLKICFSK